MIMSFCKDGMLSAYKKEVSKLREEVELLMSQRFYMQCPIPEGWELHVEEGPLVKLVNKVANMGTKYVYPCQLGLERYCNPKNVQRIVELMLPIAVSWAIEMEDKCD